MKSACFIEMTRHSAGEDHDYDYVGVDNVAGAQMAVNHLIEKGHRRIAFLGGTAEASAWKDRKQGYLNALHRAGLEVDETLILESPATRKGGMEAVRQLLRHPNLPSAVFCYNDMVAFGVMLGLKEAGLTPGYNLAVVGFDNIQEAAMFSPGLTTVSAFPQQIGTYAADLLHKRITGLADEPKRIILKPELVVRDSSSAGHS